MEQKGFKKCRSCTYDLPLKSKVCPYCGALNPTVSLKEIYITIFGVILVMGIYTYFVR